jgi:CRISPR-associated endonuclease/helicase Cas3
MISAATSDMIIKNIESLEYEDLYKNFHLIKYIPTELVFIEKDSDASDILKIFEGILDIEDRWERKNKFLEIKRKFYSYTLSVKVENEGSLFKSLKEFGHLNIITKDMVADYYDEQTGYHEPDQIIF